VLTVLQKGIIQLVRSGIKNEKLSLPENLNPEHIYNFAVAHKAFNIIYNGAVLCGIDKELEPMKKLLSGSLKEISIDATQQREYEKIREVFEKNGIDYMPLKGMSTKWLYKYQYMRSMNDIDILIRNSQYKKIGELISEMGYSFWHESNHDYVWQKKGTLVLELHKFLISSPYTEFCEYFEDSWKNAKKVGNVFEYVMSKEDEFIYIFTHFTAHYKSGGIGIKQLSDIYMFRKNNNLDEDYLSKEFKKLGIDKFYNNIVDVVSVWFEDKESTSVTDEISLYILRSGAYGLSDIEKSYAVLRNRVQHPCTKKITKIYMFFKHIFPSHNAMAIQYKILNKYAILLPVMWVVRWIKGIIFKPKNIKRLANEFNNINENKISQIKQHLKQVGLEIVFKEQ